MEREGVPLPVPRPCLHCRVSLKRKRRCIMMHRTDDSPPAVASNNTSIPETLCRDRPSRSRPSCSRSTSTPRRSNMALQNMVLLVLLLFGTKPYQSLAHDQVPKHDLFHQARPHDTTSTTKSTASAAASTAAAASSTIDDAIPIPRIIGGTQTDPTRYPYMVSLQKTFVTAQGVAFHAHVCGGTLIAPDIVLTAAHCFDCPSSGSCYDRIALGRHDFRSFAEASFVDGVEDGTAPDADGRLVFGIDEVVQLQHPGYRYNLYTNDIGNDYGLIQLPARANSVSATGGTLNYVRVNRNSNVPTGNGVGLTVTGWGALSIPTPQSNYLSPVLMETTVAYVSNGRCKQSGGYVEGTYYSYWSFVKSNMMCALTPGTDACVGDSGGPLLLRGDENDGTGDVQLGIVSFGVGCANPDFPGIYASLSDQWDWLRGGVCELSQYPPDDFICWPTPSPSTEPSVSPSSRPSSELSSSPTAMPSSEPSSLPTSKPSTSPSDVPSKAPVEAPGAVPNEAPTTSTTAPVEAASNETGSNQTAIAAPLANDEATANDTNRADVINDTSQSLGTNVTAATTAAPTAARQGANPLDRPVSSSAPTGAGNDTSVDGGGIPTFEPTGGNDSSAEIGNNTPTAPSILNGVGDATPSSSPVAASTSTPTSAQVVNETENTADKALDVSTTARPSTQAAPQDSTASSPRPTLAANLKPSLRPSLSPSDDQSASSGPSGLPSASPSDIPRETSAASSRFTAHRLACMSTSYDIVYKLIVSAAAVIWLL